MFEMITPEKAGIGSAYIKKFIQALDERGIHMHSILFMKGDKIFGEYYWAPFDKDFCHRMYSETKSYVSMAIGLLIDEGKLSLDDKIADYFPEKIDTPLSEALQNQTVRHMLTMTTVGSPGSWFSSKDKDRVHFYFNREYSPRYPGTIWEYDSAGSQVLSVLVEKLSGMSLFDFLNEKIFKKLGTFKTASMLKTPTGECWGDSSLLCTTRDMASFARFVLDYGKINGEQIISESYVREATSKQVDNSESAHDAYLSQGYGYQIWRTERNGFAFVGMGDELTICLPEKDIIFVCTADNQGSATSRSYIMYKFFDMVYDNISEEKLPDDENALNDLNKLGSNLELFSVKGQKDSSLREKINNATFVCDKNPMGIHNFTFSFENAEDGTLYYTNENGKMALPFSVNKNKFGEFPELGYSQDVGATRTTDGSKYKDAVSLAWLQENKILIFAQLIDRYFGNTSLFFSFNGDNATVTARKTAEDFLWNYQGNARAKRVK